MLYVVVVLAAVFYVALFAAWSTLGPQLESSAQTIASWRDIILAVPDPSVLIVLKEVIMLAIVYLILDTILSFVRRLQRRYRTARPSWKDYTLPDYSEPL